MLIWQYQKFVPLLVFSLNCGFVYQKCEASNISRHVCIKFKVVSLGVGTTTQAHIVKLYKLQKKPIRNTMNAANDKHFFFEDEHSEQMLRYQPPFHFNKGPCI